MYNTDAIVDAFASLTDYYQTASTTVNNTISVKGSLFVYKNYESCLQIQ